MLVVVATAGTGELGVQAMKGPAVAAAVLEKMEEMLSALAAVAAEAFSGTEPVETANKTRVR